MVCSNSMKKKQSASSCKRMLSSLHLKRAVARRLTQFFLASLSSHRASCLFVPCQHLPKLERCPRRRNFGVLSPEHHDTMQSLHKFQSSSLYAEASRDITVDENVEPGITDITAKQKAYVDAIEEIVAKRNVLRDFKKNGQDLEVVKSMFN